MIIDEFKKKLAQALDIDINDIIYPPNNDWGDLSWPIFKVAKEKKVSPDKLGPELRDDILRNKELLGLFSQVEFRGGYLNFFIKNDFLISQIISSIINNPKKYGHNDSGSSEVSIFEFSNINTHKAFHVGHLRNICFGGAIYKISLANGFKSQPISYVNDFGIHVAKTLWSYQKKFSTDLSSCYAQTVKKAEKNPAINKEVSAIMSEVEKKQGAYYKLWKKTRALSLKDFSLVYQKLNIEFKKTYFESEIIEQGIKLTKKFLKQGILRESEGAIIADLEKHNLGVLPVIRTDGTALYPVADLALNEKKFKDFKNLRNSFIIVDVRQSLYFKQLFKVLSLAGFKQKFVHLPYEFVALPEGKLSSRSGNAITFDKLYDEVLAKFIAESKSRHPKWSNKKIQENSKKLTQAILKFEMLKVSANKKIIFDINEATKFDGFNALYVLYGLVRIKSILKKGKFKFKNNFAVNLLTDKSEKDMVLKLAKYPEIVKKSYLDYDPSEIAKYLFELFKMFNDYYQRVKIIQAEDEVKRARLVFVSAIANVAENALSLLGIDSLEEI